MCGRTGCGPLRHVSWCGCIKRHSCPRALCPSLCGLLHALPWSFPLGKCTLRKTAPARSIINTATNPRHVCPAAASRRWRRWPRSQACSCSSRSSLKPRVVSDTLYHLAGQLGVTLNGLQAPCARPQRSTLHRRGSSCKQGWVVLCSSCPVLGRLYAAPWRPVRPPSCSILYLIQYDGPPSPAFAVDHSEYKRSLYLECWNKVGG